MQQTDHNEGRILILAPVGRDGPVMESLLRERGLAAEVCADAGAVRRQLADGAGALLMTEEALEQARDSGLFGQLQAQPSWSELPLIILTRGDASRVSRLLALGAQGAGAITLLERPLATITLLHAVEVALRSRRRQYQVRDLLEQEQRKTAALQAARVAALNLLDDAVRARRQIEESAAALHASELRFGIIAESLDMVV